MVVALSEVQNCLINSFFAVPEGDAIRKLQAWEDAENGENMSEHFMKERIRLPTFETFHKAVEHIVTTYMQRAEMGMHALSLMGVSMIFHFSQSRVLDMLN